MSAPKQGSPDERRKRLLRLFDEWKLMPEALVKLWEQEIDAAVEQAAKGTCLLCRDHGAPYYTPPDPGIKGSERMWIHRHQGAPVVVCLAPGAWDVRSRTSSPAGKGEEPA